MKDRKGSCSRSLEASRTGPDCFAFQHAAATADVAARGHRSHVDADWLRAHGAWSLLVGRGMLAKRAVCRRCVPIRFDVTVRHAGCAPPRVLFRAHSTVCNAVLLAHLAFRRQGPSVVKLPHAGRGRANVVAHKKPRCHRGTTRTGRDVLKQLRRVHVALQAAASAMPRGWGRLAPAWHCCPRRVTLATAARTPAAS